MSNQNDRLDKIFSALSDSTRRRMIELLKDSGELSIQQLSENFDISFQGVSKHIKVLEKAGIIAKRREGYFFLCSYDESAITPAYDWMATNYQLWAEGLDKLEQLIKKPKHDGTE